MHDYNLPSNLIRLHTPDTSQSSAVLSEFYRFSGHQFSWPLTPALFGAVGEKDKLYFLFFKSLLSTLVSFGLACPGFQILCKDKFAKILNFPRILFNLWFTRSFVWVWFANFWGHMHYKCKHEIVTSHKFCVYVCHRDISLVFQQCLVFLSPVQLSSGTVAIRFDFLLRKIIF